jgi:SAM-dependent methyltransferase
MRVPEISPLMLNVEQCIAYNKYASEPVNLNQYVQKYYELIGLEHGTIVDLGSGSCNFVIALAKFMPNLQFVCYEGSAAMIKIAKENIESANMSSRIQLIHDDISNITGKYDVVTANRLLHHINDPKSFWKLINSLSNRIFVVDINRPPNNVISRIEKFDHYQEQVYKEDLVNSMRAAYSLDEVTEQIKDYGYTIATDHCYRLFVYHTR